MDPSEPQATLALLVNPGAPFRPLALEQRALMHIEAGDRPAAVADLNAVLDDPASTEAVQARARQLSVAAGGALHPVDPAAAPPADG
jgi:hypothetical protein